MDYGGCSYAWDIMCRLHNCPEDHHEMTLGNVSLPQFCIATKVFCSVFFFPRRHCETMTSVFAVPVLLS
jgi:hypothetical protein